MTPKPNSELVVKLLPKQYQFVHSTSPEVLYSGAFGAGKSRSVCWKVVSHAIIPDNFVILCRKTRTSLMASTMRTLLEPESGLPPVLPPGSYEMNLAKSTIRIFGGGTIFYTGCEDEDKLRSCNAGAIGVDELTELSENEYLTLYSRLRNTNDPCNQIFGATNPDSTGHWAYKRFVSQGNPKRELIQTRTDENSFLPAAYLDKIKTFTGHAYRRYYEGIWCQAEGVVYLSFDPVIHCGRFKNSSNEVYLVGLDVGYTDPTAIGVFGWNPVNDKLTLYEEVYETGLLVGDISQRLQKYRPLHPIVLCDPSAALVKNQLISEGYNCVTANNNIDVGIMRVQERFRNKTLLIDEFCVNFIRELSMYVWNPKTGKPIDAENHMGDLTRYVANYLADQASLNVQPTVGIIDIKGGPQVDDDGDEW